MFTGIIEDVGTIDNIKKTDFGKKISIKTNAIEISEIKIGDSISINGICLTVVNKKNDLLSFDIVDKTISCTNLDKIEIGQYVNLERAMISSGRFDGHILQGHIETIGILVYKKNISNSLIVTIEIDRDYLKYCIIKGSIAINGISLTIAEINDNLISIAIIPHTKKYTNIDKIGIGDKVNIETDLIAKYIENIYHFNKNAKYLKHFNLEDRN